MPTARSSQISEKRAREIVSLVEDALIEGFVPPGMSGQGQSAIHRAMKVAMASGVVASEQAFRDRLARARKSGFEPDWTRYRQVQEQVRYQAPGNPAQRIDPPHTAYEPDEKLVRVLAIGDLHVDSRQDLRRCSWIGRHIAETRPEHVIQLGDWCSFDSVSAHEAKGSKGAMARPTIEQDFAAIKESLQRIENERPKDYKGRLDVVYGNHEWRLERYSENTPEVGDILTLRRDEMYAQYGWRTREYGAHRYINGVAFVHAPMNGLSKPYGGKTGGMRAGGDSLVSLVHGHTHLRSVSTVPKIGGIGKVDVVSVGAAMEWGWVESYARLGTGGWWQGVCEMTIGSGQIIDMNWTSMLTLRQRYGSGT